MIPLLFHLFAGSFSTQPGSFFWHFSVSMSSSLITMNGIRVAGQAIGGSRQLRRPPRRYEVDKGVCSAGARCPGVSAAPNCIHQRPLHKLEACHGLKNSVRGETAN
jgi:hypothetical protein